MPINLHTHNYILSKDWNFFQNPSKFSNFIIIKIQEQNLQCWQGFLTWYVNNANLLLSVFVTRFVLLCWVWNFETHFSVIGYLKLRWQTWIWETKTRILLVMRPFQEAVMEVLYQSKSQSQRQRQGLAWFRALLSIFWLQSTNDLINRSQSCPFFLMNLLSFSLYLILCFLKFLFCLWCGTESRASRESIQLILGDQEPEDFGLVIVWTVYYYMSPGHLCVPFLLNFCLDWTKWTFEVSKCLLELFLLTGSSLFKIRSSGLEMRNLWICIWRDLVMLAIVPSSLPELTTVEMVYCYL